MILMQIPSDTEGKQVSIARKGLTTRRFVLIALAALLLAAIVMGASLWSLMSFLRGTEFAQGAAGLACFGNHQRT